MNTTKLSQFAAALIAFSYILIQCFQLYVFSVLPPADSVSEQLLQGAASLNLWRSALMLLSFWGLLYVFLIVCLKNLKHNFAASVYAFLGLFIFCFIEICLRSVELFYFQIHLPAVFQQTAGINEQKALIDIFTNFQSIQFALYFPLMFSQAIAGLILAATFDRGERLNYLIIIAFALNAFRVFGRISGMYFQINWFDSFSGGLYLPFVFAIFGLIGIWLLKTKNETILPGG